MAIVDGVQAATPGDHIRTEALVLNGLGEEFKLEHVAVEYPSKDEVLVKASRVFLLAIAALHMMLIT